MTPDYSIRGQAPPVVEIYMGFKSLAHPAVTRMDRRHPTAAASGWRASWRRPWAWITAWCLLTGAAVPGAWAAKPDTDPYPVPQQTGLLVDQAAALSNNEHQALEQRLQKIQSSGRAQVAILISSGIGDEPLSEYSLRVAESWQLGRAGRDDGLLILVIPSTNNARIEVGYGLEGDIPDARASQWIDGLLPAMKGGQLAAGLDALLYNVDHALPAAAKSAACEPSYSLDCHEEWKLPFVLAIFSPFALFPLFFSRWGGLASAPLLAAMMGGAAWFLWGRTAGLATAGCAFPLPLLWSLNWDPERTQHLPLLRQYAKVVGNLIAVAVFVSVIMLFTGMGLYQFKPEYVWGAPVFAGLLAIGLAAFLFPGKPARVLMIVLRSLMHFVFALVLAAVALQGVVQQPISLAWKVALAFTTCVALALHLDSRETAAAAAGAPRRRWSLGLVGLALLILLPCGLLLLLQGPPDVDSTGHLMRIGAGGGTVAGALLWAARRGLFAAARIGLGGRFGGGGAGR